MKWLRKLAAWYLRRSLIGYVRSEPNVSDPGGIIEGWVYGEDWYIPITNQQHPWVKYAEGMIEKGE